MLDICRVINSHNGGFLPYRQGILNYASRQHSFTLTQLKDHPVHDPNRVLDLAIEAQTDIQVGSFDDAKEKLKKAWFLIETVEDIPKVTVGRSYIEIGAAHIMMRQFKKGIDSLELAKELWGKLGYNQITNMNKLKIFSMLGEAFYRMGNTEAALDNLKIARSIARSGEVEFVGYAHLLLAKLALQRGRGVQPDEITPTQETLNRAKELFLETKDDFGLALYYKELANALSARGDFQDANQYYASAYTIFDRLNDQLGLANTLFSLGQMHIRAQNIEWAKQEL